MAEIECRKESRPGVELLRLVCQSELNIRYCQLVFLSHMKGSQGSPTFEDVGKYAGKRQFQHMETLRRETNDDSSL